MHAFNSVHEDTGDEGRAAAAGHSAAQDCEEKNKAMDNLISLVTPETKFEFVSGEGDLVKASEVGGKKLLHGVASSTTKDLHGDTILQSALEDMERTAVGMTIFLNHKYDVPDDVAGTVTKAIIRQKGVDQNGDPSYQLEFDIEVEDDNEQAVRTWKYIKKGRKLGLSIGAMIPEGGAKRQKDGSYLIEHVILLETSLVGIPANPKSWIDYAASALRGMVEKAQTTQLGNPTLTLDGDTYRIEGSMKGIKLDLGADEPEFVPEISHSFDLDEDGKIGFTRVQTTPEPDKLLASVLGSWDLGDPDDRLAAIATAGEDAVNKATVWVETRDGDKITIGEPVESASVEADTEPDTTKAGGCPTCGKGRGSAGCDDAYHKTAEPDVTDAKIRVIEVDTDDSSSGDGQGASSSEPADETLAAPEADVTADGGPSILDGLPEDELVKLSFGQLRAVALRAVTELVAAKAALGEEKTARIEAEKQRDDAIAKAGELVRRTAEIIEKVGNAPLPRKAVLKGIEKEFSTSIEAYYGTEFARQLAGK
jgi:phage head maturation protease